MSKTIIAKCTLNGVRKTKTHNMKKREVVVDNSK